MIKHKTTISLAAVAAAALGGGAYAATQNSPTGRQAFINDVAGRLHVTPQQLTTAMKAAAADRIDAAVKAGRLTQAQGNRLKQRLQRGELPLGIGLREHHMFGERGLHGGLTAAAQYLGLTEVQVFKQLRSGKSLAQLAQAQGKSTAGLKSAMTAAAKARLDRAVAAQFLTGAQEQRMLSGLSSRLGELINQKGLPRPHLFRPGGFAPSAELPGPPPPPPGGAPPAAY